MRVFIGGMYTIFGEHTQRRDGTDRVTWPLQRLTIDGYYWTQGEMYDKGHRQGDQVTNRYRHCRRCCYCCCVPRQSYDHHFDTASFVSLVCDDGRRKQGNVIGQSAVQSEEGVSDRMVRLQVPISMTTCYTAITAAYHHIRYRVYYHKDVRGYYYIPHWLSE